MGFGKDGKGVIIHEDNVDITLSTLGARTAIVVNGPTLVDGFRMLKAEGFVLALGGTGGIALQFGLAQQNMSVATIAATLAAQPTGRQDTVGQAAGMQPCFVMGAITVDGPHLSLSNKDEVSQVQWTYPEDSGGWEWFVFNPFDSALASGTIVNIRTKIFGVWVGE